MSDYTPSSFAMVPGSYQQTMLPFDYQMGLYTPPYAMDNQQLANISMFGNGSPYNPYVLFNNPSMNGQLDPLLGEVNDYFFPSYYGVLIANSTANVLIQNMPQMNVQYTGTHLSAANLFHLPDSNTLGIVVY